MKTIDKETIEKYRREVFPEDFKCCEDSTGLENIGIHHYDIGLHTYVCSSCCVAFLKIQYEIDGELKYGYIVDEGFLMWEMNSKINEYVDLLFSQFHKSKIAKQSIEMVNKVVAEGVNKCNNKQPFLFLSHFHKLEGCSYVIYRFNEDSTISKYELSKDIKMYYDITKKEIFLTENSSMPQITNLL